MAQLQDAPATPTGQAQTLVYADLGPLSLERQIRVMENVLDDNQVEYAQINTELSANLKKNHPASAEKYVCTGEKLFLKHKGKQIE